MSILRIALRQLAKSPGFTAVAILTLALGIGLSTSSYSVANAFLLRALPYPESDRLVRIYRTSPQSQTWNHAPAAFLDLQADSTSYTGMVGYHYDSMSYAEPGQPAQQVMGVAATADFLNVLGVQPALGRNFAPDEDQPGKSKVVLLTNRMWVRRFNRDPAIVNRTLRLNGEPVTIIGVLPPSFDAPLVWGPAEFVRPLTIELTHRTERTNYWFNCLARLKPGVTPEQAQSELATIAARLAKAYPKESAQDGLRLVDFQYSNMDRVSRSIIWLMVGLSAAVLLIACANLASLQVARSFGRSRDYAICAALGGNRPQLMLPLLVESLVLAILGGGVGIMVGSWSNDLIGRSLIINGEPGFAIGLDPRVLWFALACSLASGVAFGLAPAWLASRPSGTEALKEGGRGTTAGSTFQRLKNVLIVAQLALALAIVGAAAAFSFGARTFLHRNCGWTVDGLFTGYISMPYNRYTDDGKVRDFQRTLLARLGEIPGVEHAVITTGLPVYAYFHGTRFVVEGQTAEVDGREPMAEIVTSTADYFSTLRIPLRAGAYFSPDLKADDPAVVIVNESLARRFWPAGSAIGKRLRLATNEQWWQVVGVVGDVAMAANLSTPETTLHLYRPLVQAPSHFVTIVLRGQVAPEALVRPVSRIVGALDADMPVSEAGALRTEINRSLANLDVIIVNLGSFAVMGLLIAVLGLYGVISQLTAQRTRDIGVRIALGAQHRDIIAMVLGHGVRLLVAGLLAGLPLFYAVQLLLHRAMPEMPLPGWWLVAVTVVMLGMTALFACWLPAHRATRINPVDALRAD